MIDIKKRLSNLLTVKSIMTLVLTIVFAYLSFMRYVTPEQFLTIFTMIVGFYFGTQHEKKSGEPL